MVRRVLALYRAHYLVRTESAVDLVERLKTMGLQDYAATADLDVAAAYEDGTMNVNDSSETDSTGPGSPDR